MVTRGGELRIWSFSASSPGVLVDGRRFVIGMAEDITGRKRAEQARHESDERFRVLVEAASQAVWETDPKGVVIEDSPSWRTYTGQTLEEYRGYGWVNAVHPDDQAYVEREWREAVAAGRNVDAEFRLRGPDGGWRWTNVRAAPIRKLDGSIIKWVGMNLDITSRKQAEEALRQSQERLAMELAATKRLQEISAEFIREDKVDALHKQILDAAIAIMGSDMASMQILDRDQDALRMLAWRGFDPAFGEIFELNGPDTKTSCSVARRLGRRVVVPDVETCDFIAGTPALEDHRKMGIRAMQSTPLFSRDGHFVGIISTHWRQPHQPSEHELRLLDVLARQAADLIERSQADEELRKSEERFRTIADSSPMMIWMTDREGHTSFRNRTYLEYAGVTAEEAPAFDWSGIIHPDDRDAYAAAFQTALQKRETFHQRVRRRRFDGQWRWFEARGNPVFDGGGNMLGFIGSSADITEIYESQQALKDLDQRKDEFLANMSHEIRSPLTGIMGYADILLDRLKDPEDIECLNTIKESGDYLIEIVNDILDLAKIEAGKLVLHIETVPVHSLLREVQGLMDVRSRQKKLPLSLRYQGTLPETIQTDRTRLRQVLINLVSNAIKFTDHGCVEIVAGFIANDSLLQIEVIDTGIGIAPEHQEILFQPFTQADSTSTRQYGGTGLGLTITKRLAEMLGGSISFESALGKGSTFRVMIPAGALQNDTKTPRAAAPAGSVEAKLSLRDHRVLVVDDREEICYLVSRYVKEAGGRPSAVSNGAAAIAAMQAAQAADPFGAMILDIHMPGIDGYEVARRLRSKGFKTPIIALTAGAMVGDREKCLKAGCDDYLTKPIDRQALVQLIARRAQKTRADRGKLRVLLVDDSYNACKFLSAFLEKRGHEVRSTYDGASALLIAQDFSPEVILLDIRLPDMSGYDLMERLKALGSVNGARFIALSGYRDIDAPGSVKFDHFLEKPLDTVQLETLLQSIAN